MKKFKIKKRELGMKWVVIRLPLEERMAIKKLVRDSRKKITQNQFLRSAISYAIKASASK